MSWQQFAMRLADLDTSRVEKVLLAHGALSVTFTDAADDPVLEPGVGETPLWQDTRITGLFAKDIDLSTLPAALCDNLGIDQLPDYDIEILEDREWEREWLSDFGPMQFGQRLWVCPGESEPPVPDAVTIKLDPGLAFGTGTHPTTSMCLAWLDQESVKDARVLDYGCGSGILAIAALKLGASEAVGMDIDPQALVASSDNAHRNDVELELHDSAAGIDGVFDLVLANILAGPLVQYANQIAEYVKTDGRLALSGILEEQAVSVRNAYEQWIDFDDAETMVQDGQTWVRLTGTRAAS